jgi:hypothetical protein
MSTSQRLIKAFRANGASDALARRLLVETFQAFKQNPARRAQYFVGGVSFTLVKH